MPPCGCRCRGIGSHPRAGRAGDAHECPRPRGPPGRGAVNTVTVTAPGKLYLVGEYAVLDGAPALLAAIERRVSVSVTDSESWSITSPQLGIDRLDLGEGGALPEGIEDALRRRLRLFDRVRSAVAERSAAGPAVHIDIDSSPFFVDSHKLGLGSSAAVAVALTAALAAAYGPPLTPEALFATASRAHTEAQGGRGSGGDVAAGVYGGLLRYTRGEPPAPRGWPNGLGFFAVTTGSGSSTVDLVSRVADFAVRDPRAHRRDLDRLGSLAARVDDALADADSFLELAAEYFAGVETLDRHAGAGIVSERHRELRELATASGAVFKTSGAGGGDLGLVFAKLDSTDQLQSVFTEAGATVIPAPFSPDGVRTGDA
nr:hypothetical protein [Terrimesophilobacter mesophilus]